MYGRRIVTFPYRIIEDDETLDPTYLSGSKLRERTVKHVKLLQHFQTRWKREYLTSLRETHRASETNVQEIRIGDVVLIHNNKPQLTWRLAVIEDLVQGMDGYIRAAKIQTNNGRTNRPIAKLIPLEVNEHDSLTDDTDATLMNQICDDTVNTDDSDVHQRPVKATASKARDLIRKWTSIIAALEDVKNYVFLELLMI